MQLPKRVLRSISAMVLSVGLGGAASLALVTDASAHTSAIGGVATCDAATGNWSVAWTGHTDKVPANDIASVTVTAATPGGSTVPTGPVTTTLAPNADYSFAQTGIAASATQASVSVHVSWTPKPGTQGQSDTFAANASGTVSFVGSCARSAVAAAATFTDPTCANRTGSYTIPASTGVDYFVKIGAAAAQLAAAGTVNAPAGTVITVTAVAKTGFTLSGTTTWTHTVQSAGDCTTHVLAITPVAVAAACTGPGAQGAGSITVTAVTGVVYHLGSAAGPVLTGTISEPAGSYSVVAVAASSGYSLDAPSSFTVVVASAGACTVNATPVAPTISQGVCTLGVESAASFTIPTTVGITYKDGTTVLAPGAHPIAYGAAVTITAVAAPGYAIATGATASWTLSAAAQLVCSVQQPAGSVSTTCNTVTFTFTNPQVAGAPSTLTSRRPAVVLPPGTVAHFAIESSNGANWDVVADEGDIVVAPGATVTAAVAGAGTYRAVLKNGDGLIVGPATVSGSCSVAPTPTPTTTPTPTITPTVTPTVTPSVLGETFVANPPAAAPPVAAPPVATLPFTGLPLVPVLGIGLGLILAGALLIASVRKHRIRYGSI
ncbi:MAG: hypothetical protein QOG69_1646 [Actinomycetota bacterium]|jgi:hypothetical protein|nr:hypothetical protein [Actinomycetota bacterium]